MLGSSPIAAVLGSGVDNTDHDAVRSFIRAACNSGLSLLLIGPGGKVPFDGRTARRRLSDDRQTQEEARVAGLPNWEKMKSPSGLALATTDPDKFLKPNGYLDEYIRTFGAGCGVNLAVEVGGSRLIVVDCDTNDQRLRFLEAAEAPEETPVTVASPGTRAADGTWAHEPGNGHFYFIVPDGVELPTSAGAMTWGDDAGFAVLWDRRYVLIPPSTRAEGPYELIGEDYTAPQWLIDAINDHCHARTNRREQNSVADPELASTIDSWAVTVNWSDILTPLGWTPVGRPDNCGCGVWTAPGGNHSSPKSATAHDSGCSLGRYNETNAPLHIWTDHDIEPFAAHLSKTKTKTLSKLQAVACSEYDGNVGKAMDYLGLGSAFTTMGPDMGGSKSNMVNPPPPPTAPHPPPETTEPVPVLEVVDSPFTEDVAPDPDVFDSGVIGVPIIAPPSYWRDMPPPEYIVDKLIEHGGLSAMIGPPGVGKSSVALDMACHIAVGKPWQGRKVLKTKVLYLPGEGHSGVNQRIKAWTHEHDIPYEVLNEGMRLGESIIQLTATPESWATLIEYMMREEIGLVIFDTFARMANRLEENSATDVGLAIMRFDYLRRHTNAGVLLLHHTAKGNPSSGRGSSALMGALDSELLVRDATWTFDDLGLAEGGQVPAGKPIELLTTKQKNCEQLDHPIPLLMRNCVTFEAPYITGPMGYTDPMIGDIFVARPKEESALESAIRIAEFTTEFTEQGVTRPEICMGVRPDPYTAGRRDSAKAWKQKVALAVDLGLRLGLIETVSGQRTGSRYERGTVSVEQARSAHAQAFLDGGDE